MANEIQYFTSSDTGAPTLNNANGSLIDVLDACLINGYNSKSVTSIVVAANVATATVSAHGYAGGTGKCVDIAGATPVGLNGRKKNTTTGANTFTFAAPGITDQTATGTITVKRSPLGWSKAFSATGKAIYARTDVAATAMLLRIDDTGTGVASTTYARARMVESASDIDTFTGPAPTDAQVSGGQYWPKGTNSSTAKPWVLVGDSRTFYFFTDDVSYTFATNGSLQSNGFGDFKSYKAGDVYAAFIAGAASAGNGRFLYGFNSFDASFCLVRIGTGLGAAVQAYLADRMTSTAIGGVLYPGYPSYVDNGMPIDIDVLIREQNATYKDPYRGIMRGMAHPLANLVAAGLHLSVLSGIEGFAGEFLVVNHNFNGSNNPGAVLFDITGPWL